MTRRRGRNSKEPISRIVYVLESPLSHRDAERYGLRILRDEGFEILVWNVAPIFLPNSEKQWYQPATDFAVTRLVSIAELRSACDILDVGDAVIMMVGVYRGQLHSHMEMLAAVSTTRALLCAVVGAHPPDMGETENNRRHARLVGESGSKFGFFSRCRAVTSRTIYAHGWMIHAYRRWLALTTEVRPLDIVWVGATSVQIHQLLIGPCTQVEYIHVFDYDVFLSLSQLDIEDSKDLVLIDSMGPFHPDFVSHSIDVSDFSADEYFAELCEILAEIESVSGLSVTIAAHPRAAPGTLESLYGNRDVVYGRTAQCVARARAVILTVASTAVSLAVVMMKPVLLVTMSSDPTSKNDCEILSPLLHLSKFNPGVPSAEWKLPEVNRGAYDNYLANYIKRPSTPELPFWRVVAHTLRSESQT